MAEVKSYTLYKIYSTDMLLYIGRTKQPLQRRIRGHLFAKPMHRIIDIDHVSRIEYTEFATEADMNLYEIYYILTLKPPLNVDDKTRDYPTVTLPDVAWNYFSPLLWDKWREQIQAARERRKNAREQLRGLEQERCISRSKLRMGEITQEQHYNAVNKIKAEMDKLHEQIRNVSL